MSGMVYLLDTNVISELMRPEPSPAVLAWIDGAGVEGLALSAVSRWEIRYGLALLPEGKRRDDLALRFDGLVADSGWSMSKRKVGACHAGSASSAGPKSFCP